MSSARATLSDFDQQSRIDAQIFVRRHLEAGAQASREVVGLRNDLRLPRFVRYCPARLRVDKAAHFDSACRLVYRFLRPPPQFHAGLMDAEAATPARSGPAGRPRGRASAGSAIATRTAFKSLDTRPPQGRKIDQLGMENLVSLGVEVFCDSRGELLPDPRADPVLFVALSVTDENAKVVAGNLAQGRHASRLG